MDRKSFQQISILLIFLATIVASGCGQKTGSEKKAEPEKEQIAETEKKQEEANYKVTFIELGSVRCIPCQQMQPIMESVEKKYGDQVNVVFHDVWTSAGKPYADKYDIKAIPTQIFLDENGEEYFRHEGFFAEDKLVNVLKQKGVK
ncbi:MAG: thioredoxin domain-containing protein [Prolixibacteraceae bacterium]